MLRGWLMTRHPGGKRDSGVFLWPGLTPGCLDVYCPSKPSGNICCVCRRDAFASCCVMTAYLTTLINIAHCPET